MTAPDPWRNNPAVAEGLAKLERAEVELDQKVLEAKQMKQQMPRGGLSPADIQQVEEHARSKDAPKELRELQKRIDRGDLSWNDIGQGRFLDDPGVRAALSGSVEGMRQAYTMIEEGQDIDDIVDLGGPPAPASTTEPDDGENDPRRRDDPPDDEYFDRSVYDK
jgi:hypothetical protein